MNILVTGSTGFLGRHVVRAAVARGHRVRAVVRPAGVVPAEIDAGAVEPVRLDLRSRAGLPGALAGIDVVIHAAAAKSGDMYAQYAGTVVATENLLWAMDQAGETAGGARGGPSRLVVVSSFSVYDYTARAGGSLLAEDWPIERDTRRRDEYCHTKLVQESLCREHAARAGWECTVVRPGVIYGAGNLWTARLGAPSTPARWVRIGSRARLPLTYVENCAEAIVLAAETPGSHVLNLVDDDPPTQARYARAVLSRLRPRPRTIVIPRTALGVASRLAWLVNRRLLRGRAKLPGILVPARVQARFRPLRYSAARARATLNWRPRYGLEDALDRCMAAPAPAGERCAPEEAPP